MCIHFVQFMSMDMKCVFVTVYKIFYSVYGLASSPVFPIFSTHTRKEGEPGIQNHVHDVGPYTKGRKGGGW